MKDITLDEVIKDLEDGISYGVYLPGVREDVYKKLLEWLKELKYYRRKNEARYIAEKFESYRVKKQRDEYRELEYPGFVLRDAIMKSCLQEASKYKYPRKHDDEIRREEWMKMVGMMASQNMVQAVPISWVKDYIMEVCDV